MPSHKQPAKVVVSAAYGAPETWAWVRNALVVRALPKLPTRGHPPSAASVLPNYVLAAARAAHLAVRENADLLVSEGALELLVAGSIFRLLGLKEIPFVAVDAHYPPEMAPNLRWRLQRQLTRLVLGQAGLGCLASEDIARFQRLLGADPARLGLVRHYASPTVFRYAQETRPLRDVIFCGGIYQRDFETLYEAARHIEAPVEVITDPSRLPSGRPPRNLTVLGPVSSQEFRERLATSRLVALPLKPVSWVAGLSVLADALALGRPVVASATWGMNDYIEHGRSGLLVEPSQPEQLAEALNYLWRQPEEATALGQEAALFARRQLTFKAHLAALQRLVRRSLGINLIFDYEPPAHLALPQMPEQAREEPADL